MKQPDRRELLAGATRAGALLALSPSALSTPRPQAEHRSFSISLAEWSLHRALQAGELEHLDFAKTARSLGIGAVEYVNSFFKDRAGDEAYLADMRRRAADEGVQSLLIMVDGEGALAGSDEAERGQALENHHRWVDAAAALGCHSIRVNAAGDGPREEHAARAAESLVKLAEYAAPVGLNILVENHGGPSSDGAWLAGVMRLADHPRVGTLPDFGNFHLGEGAWYDRYKGVAELMPWARAVSAKSHEFDEEGRETRTDYRRMLGVVLDAGYRGWIGVEYEGSKQGELEGIKLTRELLERVRTS
jgi:sugar phosphate isomerase/epimerase